MFGLLLSFLSLPFRMVWFPIRVSLDAMDWLSRNSGVIMFMSLLLNVVLVPLVVWIVLSNTGEVAVLAARALIEASLLVFVRGFEWSATQMAGIRASEVAMAFLCLNAIWAKLSSVSAGARVQYKPEKLVVGSPMVRADGLPKFQASIMEHVDGVWLEIGQCFRVGRILVTAAHVVREEALLQVRSARGMLEIESCRFRRVSDETDLACVTLSDVEFANLALTSARFMGQSRETCYVTVQSSVERTMGAVCPEKDLFGFVRYLGSTKPGFSGAPYYLGNVVYGMHLGSLIDNMGYDSAYLAMKLRGVNEDSSEYFERQALKAQTRGKSLQFRPTGDPEEVEVRIGGLYHRVRREVVEGLLGAPAGEEPYLDVETARGNLNRPSASALGRGPVSTTRTVVPTPDRPVSRSTRPPQGVSRMTASTEPRVSTPAQSSDHSPSTPASGSQGQRRRQPRLSLTDASTIWNKLSVGGGSTLSQEEIRSFRQFVDLTSSQPLDTASSQTSVRRTDRS